MESSIRRTSISLPAELLKEGQRLAKLRRRNFSNYVAGLIAADSEKTGSAVFFPQNSRSRLDSSRISESN